MQSPTSRTDEEDSAALYERAVLGVQIVELPSFNEDRLGAYATGHFQKRIALKLW